MPEGMQRGSGCTNSLPVSGLTIKLLAQLRYASRDVDANGDPTRVYHESSPRREPTQDPVTVNFGKIAAMSRKRA